MRFEEFRTNESLFYLKSLCESLALSEELRKHNAGEYPEEEKEQVSQVQHILSVLGYDVGPTGVDGKYGSNTARAVAAFKSDYNIPGGGDVFGEPSLQAIEKLGRGELQPARPFRGSSNSSSNRPRGGRQDSPSSEFTRPTSSGALFTLDGSQSRMTSRDAEANMDATLAGPYREMVRLFGREVGINDAIARAGTSRETNTPGSQHFHGRALDLNISGMRDNDKLRLVQAARRAGFSGFGFGSNVLHVDTGPNRYWDYDISTFGGVSVASLGAQVTGLA